MNNSEENIVSSPFNIDLWNSNEVNQISNNFDSTHFESTYPNYIRNIGLVDDSNEEFSLYSNFNEENVDRNNINTIPEDNQNINSPYREDSINNNEEENQENGLSNNPEEKKEQKNRGRKRKNEENIEGEKVHDNTKSDNIITSFKRYVLNDFSKLSELKEEIGKFKYQRFKKTELKDKTLFDYLPESNQKKFVDLFEEIYEKHENGEQLFALFNQNIPDLLFDYYYHKDKFSFKYNEKEFKLDGKEKHLKEKFETEFLRKKRNHENNDLLNEIIANYKDELRNTTEEDININKKMLLDYEFRKNHEKMFKKFFSGEKK